MQLDQKKNLSALALPFLCQHLPLANKRKWVRIYAGNGHLQAWLLKKVYERERECVLEHENPLCLLTNWNYSWNDNMKWMVWEEGDFYKGRPYSPRYPLKWTTKLTWDLLLQLIYFMQGMVWYDMNSLFLQHL